MRVGSGKYRGRNLFTPADSAVRPTADKVKGAVFDMLRPRIAGAVFVDLFAGTGAMGIEALSNGASEVYFADRERRAVDIIKKNLTGIDEKYEIFETDFRRAIERLNRRGVAADVVFADPPYRAGLESEIAAACSTVLSTEGVLVLEHARGIAFDAAGLVTVKEKAYGITAVSVLRKPRTAAVTGTFDPFTLGHLYLVEKALAEFDKVYVAHLINPVKTIKYPLQKRLEISAASVAAFGDRVAVESYDGTAADYALLRGCAAFVRGYRDKKDLAYETEMARFNLKQSGIPTVLYEADRKEISSTEVRRLVESNAPLDGYVAENAKEDL